MSFFGNLLKGAVGGITGFATGGLAGAAVGLIGAARGGGGQRPAPALPELAPVGVGTLVQQDRSIISRAQDRFGRFDPPFGGEPGIAIPTIFGGIQAGFQETQQAPARTNGRGATIPMIGAIGTEPVVRNIATRKCPRGSVLAIDGLCYPRQMVPKAFRVWPTEPKPPVTRADKRAITKAKGTKERLVRLTKDAGAHASMTKPRPRARARKEPCD